MFTDTHCHLNFDAFAEDLDAVMQRAKEAGVSPIIIPGAKMDSSQRAVEISRRYAGCYAAVGIHPHHAQEFVEAEHSSSLRRMYRNPKVVAVGEIGMDRYQYKNYPAITDDHLRQQRQLLLLQLHIAKDYHLPVILHCREAQQDLLLTLDAFQREYTMQLRGVFHCFDGNEAYLRAVLSRGFYVGFDGNCTYSANSHLRERIRETPLDRLLLETDAPFLAPVPHRGQRNEPAYIPLIARLVAEIHKKSLEEIAEITTKNASCLFKLPRTGSEAYSAPVGPPSPDAVQ